MLLIKNPQKLKLQQPALKILKLSPSLNGYVFTTTTEQPFEKVVHVDKNGKTLWERKYQDSVDTFGMFNEREVIVLNVGEGNIEVIDLLTHTFKSYTHDFSFENTASMDILVFNDSKLFCVVEEGSSGDHRLFLTYYTYETDNVKAIASYKSGEGEWEYGHQVGQVNTRSKVAWWRPKHDNTIQFFTYSISENNGGTLANVRINNTLAADYRMGNFVLQIANLWETAPDVYLLVCNTNRNSTEAPPNNNYILDARKEIIRETKFSFPDKWNKNLRECFNLGEVSVFHTFFYEKGDSLPTPVFYVNNEREEIILTQQWRSSSTINFYIPGYDTSTVIEAEHDNGDVSDISVTTKRLMTQKEMYLHFILHINEDFDDDLLQDAVELLTDL